MRGSEKREDDVMFWSCGTWEDVRGRSSELLKKITVVVTMCGQNFRYFL